MLTSTHNFNTVRARTHTHTHTHTVHQTSPKTKCRCLNGRTTPITKQNSKRAAGDTAPSSRLVEEWTKGNLHNSCARAHGSRMHGSRIHRSRAHGTTHVQNSTLRKNKTTPGHKMGRRQARRQHGHQNLRKPTHRCKYTQPRCKSTH